MAYCYDPGWACGRWRRVIRASAISVPYPLWLTTSPRVLTTLLHRLTTSLTQDHYASISTIDSRDSNLIT